jgi:hypothetical protein
MDGLSNLRSTLHSDNNMLFSRKIRPVTDLADRLKQQADLTIPTLSLCTKVEGFGRYDPIDPPRLTAQKERQAIIYCELENFASQLNGAKMWQTDVIQDRADPGSVAQSPARFFPQHAGEVPAEPGGGAIHAQGDDYRPPSQPRGGGVVADPGWGAVGETGR